MRRSCARRHARGSAGRSSSASTIEPIAADADPPPRRDAVAVAEPGRADRRAGADVGREHRRENQPGSELPAGDEEVAACRVTRRPIQRPRPTSSAAVAERGAPAAGSSRGSEVSRGATSSDRARPGCRRRRWPGSRRGRSRRAIASAASAPISVMSASPSHRPVASEKTVSPSPMVCDGMIARAYPSSAISAMRVACALVSFGVGRDEADGRVLAGARRADRSAPERRIVRASANVPSGLRTPATTLPVSGSMMSPTAFTATMARDDEAVGQRDRRSCRARPSSSGPGRRTCRRSRRRRRRSCLLRPAPVGRRLGGAVAAVGGRPDLRVAADAEVEQDRGRHDRHAATARTAQPMLCSSSQRTVPVAASRPNALPPASTTALTLSTMLSGSSRSVSRVPGAPPRCETPPTRVAVDEDHGAAGRPLGERVVADLDALDGGQARFRARGDVVCAAKGPRGGRAGERHEKAVHAPTILHRRGVDGSDTHPTPTPGARGSDGCPTPFQSAIADRRQVEQSGRLRRGADNRGGHHVGGQPVERDEIGLARFVPVATANTVSPIYDRTGCFMIAIL